MNLAIREDIPHTSHCWCYSCGTMSFNLCNVFVAAIYECPSRKIILVVIPVMAPDIPLSKDILTIRPIMVNLGPRVLSMAKLCSKRNQNMTNDNAHSTRAATKQLGLSGMKRKTNPTRKTNCAKIKRMLRLSWKYFRILLENLNFWMMSWNIWKQWDNVNKWCRKLVKTVNLKNTKWNNVTTYDGYLSH